jgi:methionyl-tRNA formyltransferase
MRVVLFGSGSPASLAALEALATAATVVAVVVPGGGPVRGPRSAVRALARRRANRGLVRAADERGIPVLRHRSGRDAGLAADLRRLGPDLGCVATYPWLLDAAMLAAFPRGTLGVHPSLLPRHRGPAPLFWTYFHDDALAGVTVHWLTVGEDEGDIVLQESVPLARGRFGPDLYAEIARRGAALLARAVAQVEAGTAARTAQDPSLATREPAPERTEWSIDFATWGAERVWHFLRGVGGSHPALRDARGRLVLHGPARGYRPEPHAARAGSIDRVPGGWRLACRDGFVDLDTRAQSTNTNSSGADRNA